MTKITIHAERDLGGLRLVEIMADDRSVPYMGAKGILVHRAADDLCKCVGEWKTEEESEPPELEPIVENK